MTNAQISEWLARCADLEDSRSVKARALRRAARAALSWPREVVELLEADIPITTLARVGPYIASVIRTGLENGEVVVPDPLRTGFLTRSAVDRLLAGSELGDAVHADFQVHTTWSDGHADIGTMADEAVRLGRRYIALTDHSKGLAIAGGKDEHALAAQRLEIAAQNERLQAAGTDLTILAAIEMNLSPTGEGDMEPTFLNSLELVLGAFHSKLRLGEDQTDRYLAALRNPTIDVLAHPRGRIFNFRLGLTARWEVVFEEALRRDVALEIDGYPDRQDLDVDLLRLAAEMGIRVSLGSDAHAPGDLTFLDFATAAAVQAGIRSERVINTMSAAGLREWVGSRRRAPSISAEAPAPR